MSTIMTEPEPFVRMITCCFDCPCFYVDMRNGDHQYRCNLLDEDLYVDVTEQVSEHCPMPDRHIVIMKAFKAVPLPCLGGAVAEPFEEG